MSNAWCHLEYRYGESSGAPILDEITVVVRQLYEENLPGMTEGDYEEHGVASLRYGYDEGPMYVLGITRRGTARWEEWADPDYNEELCPTKEIKSLRQDQAVLLWQRLSAGDIESIRAFFHVV